MTPKENLLRTIKHDRPEWVPNGMEDTMFFCPDFVTRPNTAGYDSWNVKWEYEGDAEGGTYPAHDYRAIGDVSKWREQIRFPDLDAIDWTQARWGWGGQGGKMRPNDLDREKHLICGVIEFGLFERSYLLLGMEDALMAYLAEPELMDELVGALADFQVRLIERFDDAFDVDMIWYGDDWGTQANLFLPPDTWRRVVKPHTKRIYDCMKSRGILINQHSCGKIESVFGDIVEMGVNVWNPCQPCNDLAALKRQYAGRVTFCGGIDSQFVLARPGITPAEVRAEVRRRIDELAWGGGGYIAGPSHGVPYDGAIIHAMNDEIATYGREFCRRCRCGT